MPIRCGPCVLSVQLNLSLLNGPHLFHSLRHCQDMGSIKVRYPIHPDFEPSIPPPAFRSPADPPVRANVDLYWTLFGATDVIAGLRSRPYAWVYRDGVLGLPPPNPPGFPLNSFSGITSPRGAYCKANESGVPGYFRCSSQSRYRSPFNPGNS